MIGGSLCVTGAESHLSHLQLHEDHFTMATKKHVGIGAECTVSLHFLHPNHKVKTTIPNQTSARKLPSLIVQSKEKKTIWREEKDCIVFWNEDFNELIWCLSTYIKVDVEGPEETFFPLETRSGGGGGQPAQEGATDGGAPDGIANQNDVEQQDLPIAIQELLNNTHHLDSNTIAAAMVAAPMVDDHNMPTLENIPDVISVPNDIIMGWEHSNLCLCRFHVLGNAKPRFLFVTTEQGEPSILQLFEGLFFKSYLQVVIIPKTNDAMTLHKKLTYGDLLRWLGLWFLMATIIGLQRHEFWSLSPVSAFEGAPLRLCVYMGQIRFVDILSTLQFTDSQPPAYLDKFWEVRQMVKAWVDNMNTHFCPGYVNCLDESMSITTKN